MADFRTSLSVLEKNVEINQNALKFGWKLWKVFAQKQ